MSRIHRKTTEKSRILRDLQQIPGIGPKMAEDLWTLEIRSVTDLRGKDPELLYQALCHFHGQTIDRCVLYVFRCAVYYASVDQPEPALLRWWNWQDKIE